MCRSHGDPTGHRRCKTTEGERIAKAKYRAGLRLTNTYTSQLNPKPTAPAEPEQITVEASNDEQKITELLSIIDEPQGDLDDSEYEPRLAAAYISLGELLAKEAEPAEQKLADLIEEEETLREQYKEEVERTQAAKVAAQDAEVATLEDVYNVTGINRHTHPVMTERNEALQEQFPEQWQRIVDAETESNEANSNFWKAIQNRNHLSILRTTVGEEGRLSVAITERREAYIRALKNVGVEFAENQEIVHADKSNKKALEALNSSLKYFPKSWVDESNSSESQMIVKSTKGRAHYSNKASQAVTVPKLTVAMKPAGWEPGPNDTEYANAVRLDPEKDLRNHRLEYKEPLSGRTYHIRAPRDGNHVWLVPEFQHYERRTPSGEITYEPTRKTGWEAYEVDGYDYSVTPPVKRVHTRYRKMKTSRLKSSNAARPELTVSGETLEERQAVASHEFMHRVESMNPEVLKAEKAFLAHRTKKYTDEPERLSLIYRGERGYKDSFATHYIGKVYDGRYYEIMSVGMETLLYGRHGAFHGRGKHNKDLEHRNFVLGVLASTSRKTKADK